MQYFSSSFRLGILGGGQLGKMLLYETRKWDVNTKVLDPSADAPCRISCNEFVQGDLLDYQTVLDFGKGLDLLTIEIENVNIEALKTLKNQGVKVYPEPEALEIISNKSKQKDFYREKGIPTAAHQNFSSKEGLLEAQLSYPCVWKSAEFGYDGKGVSVLRDAEDLKALPDTPCLIEEKIAFKKELAVIVARNENGEMTTYPVVGMDFHPTANQVEYVVCPAAIDDVIANEARQIAVKVAENLKITGLLAVELFLDQDDRILVNEVAPRPHNSGHYSIEASYTNQFEQHLRAILGLPLGSTDSKAIGIMVNLVGAEGFEGPVLYENIEQVMKLEGVTVHIYGKSETRPFRKMGHVTIVDQDRESAYEKAKKVKEILIIKSNG
ncbi:MAG: 5-(carboxyamino)imidazole ribonucleotide synthase [Flavobacteriaceae bacterium]